MKKIFRILLLLLFSTLTSFGQYNSVLANGDWVRLATDKSGVYKLSYSYLESIGFSMNNLEISKVKLYGNGSGMLQKLNSVFRHDDLVENATTNYDANNNGIFDKTDFILFYGSSPNSWFLNESSQRFEHQTHLFADEVNYFITISDQNNSKKIEQSNEIQNPSVVIDVFDDYSFHESELENLIHSGQEWFGEQFHFQNNQEFNFSFPNIVQTIPISITAEVVARSLVNTSFTVQVNNTLLSTLSIPNVSSASYTDYIKRVKSTSNYLSSSSDLSITLDYHSTDNTALSWLNYIELNAKRHLKMSGNAMHFRSISTVGNSIGEFVLSNANTSLRVWDITEPTAISQLPITLNSGILSFTDSLSELKEYIVFNSSSYLAPENRGQVENQNLHNTSSAVDFVIVSHPKFITAANRLADFHTEKDGLNTIVVTTTQIYNEFSSGVQDVSAIRDFLRMLYKRPSSKLKYVLLFGDGSYDPKNRVEDNTNYVVTYQSKNSIHPTLTFVTDDFFGLLDDDEGLFLNDLVDIGVGRFPVTTLSDANILVDKVERYYAQPSFDSWRNDILFIADDGDKTDGNIHMSQADSLANIVAKKYRDINIEKIYLDNYEQESTPGGTRSEATQNAINSKIGKGALLVNYTGHGGELGLSNERIIEVKQINDWENINKLPLFMTASCNFSHFDNPERVSAGEYVLLNPKGGAIALLSTSRLVYATPNYNLNKNFIKVLFEKKENGEFPRLGDVFRETKVLSGTIINNRNFTLLGDPALCLAYPEYEIETTSIIDTLKALGEVTITGEVFGKNGVLTDFNGIVYPTVYDKEIIRTTLGQESCTPMPYRDQNNTLYKGAASVLDGKFSFSFVVPKDIAYNYGVGKISYYAVSDDQEPVDASGSDEGFVIGGTADDITYDYEGAELEIYMNTRNFSDGGITDENPVLLADIFDFSGINTVGNGIGHDVTAILDGNTTNPYILNDFYEAVKDDYTRGVIEFPFYDLAKGEHTLTLKVWDVFNNSSEANITFIVTDENEFTISDYNTNPNPFSNSTDLYFQHNKANQVLDVVLEIYSITGTLVKRHEESYSDNGYRVGPIKWDGDDEYGGKLSAGIYIAKLGVNSSDGDFTSKSIRIILLP